MPLASRYGTHKLEAGCDEAGRGCLAGPVFAAAVIMPDDFHDQRLNDSKQMTAANRERLREVILREAVYWSVASVDPARIDKINILHASIEAMNIAVGKLPERPDLLTIDGNRFHTDSGIPYVCIVGGDGLLVNIAAASVLAKTFRDEHMCRLAKDYPEYGWEENKGYPTRKHRIALIEHGPTPHHRRSFAPLLTAPTLFDNDFSHPGGFGESLL